jgi:hypothetical protein
MTSTELLAAVIACRECTLVAPLMCALHDQRKKELEERAREPPQLLEPNDPREQRALALRHLVVARHELQAALGYLRNSDQGSVVIDDCQRLVDKTGHLQHTLDWRQRREATP